MILFIIISAQALLKTEKIFTRPDRVVSYFYHVQYCKSDAQFFPPLKVSESLCLFCLKISVTVTSKEMIFLSNCPILNLQETVHLYFRLISFLYLGTVFQKSQPAVSYKSVS